MKLELFVDLDGVLADFKEGFYQRTNVPFEARPSRERWALLQQTCPYLYKTLPVIDGAREFWEKLSFLSPKILTAIPSVVHLPRCTDDKREWVWNNIDKDAEVLFGPFAKDKQFHCKGPHCILIDDSEINVVQWRRHGGQAILHRSFQETLSILPSLHGRINQFN